MSAEIKKYNLFDEIITLPILRPESYSILRISREELNTFVKEKHHSCGKLGIKVGYHHIEFDFLKDTAELAIHIFDISLPTEFFSIQFRDAQEYIYRCMMWTDGDVNVFDVRVNEIIDNNTIIEIDEG